MWAFTSYVVFNNEEVLLLLLGQGYGFLADYSDNLFMVGPTPKIFSVS